MRFSNIINRHCMMHVMFILFIIFLSSDFIGCAFTQKSETNGIDQDDIVQSEFAWREYKSIDKRTADRFIYEEFIAKHPKSDVAYYAHIEIASLDFKNLIDGKIYRLSKNVNSWERFWDKYHGFMKQDVSVQQKDFAELNLYPLLVESVDRSKSFEVWLQFIKMFPSRPEAEKFVKSAQNNILDQPITWDTINLTGRLFDCIENDSQYADFVAVIESKLYDELISKSYDLNENMTFIKNFQDSKYNVEIENKFFKLFVTLANTPEDIGKFLDAFPESSMKSKAIQKIEDLEFDYAQNAPDKVRALKQFLDHYPDSQHRLRAEQQIERMQYTLAVESKDAKKIEAFLTEYPDSSFRDKALNEIERILQDRVPYDKLLQSLTEDNLVQDIECLTKFMRDYPENLFFPETEQKLSTSKMILTLVNLLKVPMSTRNNNDPQLTPEEIVEQYEDSVVFIKTSRGFGTGFIITEEGHIVTNYHIIEHANFIQILTKQNTYTPKVTHISPRYDVAVLKISGIFKPVILGNARNARKGEKVVVIGHPQGYEYTVTDGLLSSLPRTYRKPGPEYIQISAPASPGNSGGPVFNVNGHVIGIISAAEPASIGIDDEGPVVDKAENINFAISISEAIPDIVEAIIKDSRINHPILKIEMKD